MKKYRELVVNLAYIILGIVFLAACYHKLLKPREFAEQIYMYRILPDYLINLTAVFLPWLELVCGIAVLPPNSFRKPAMALILAMLIVFTVAIAFNVYRGLDISCGCFSTSTKGQRIGWQKLMENTALILLGLLAFWPRREPCV